MLEFREKLSGNCQLSFIRSIGLLVTATVLDFNVFFDDICISALQKYFDSYFHGPTTVLLFFSYIQPTQVFSFTSSQE